MKELKAELKAKPSFIIGDDSSSDESDESAVLRVSVAVQTENYCVSEPSSIDDNTEPRPLEECIEAMKSDMSEKFSLARLNLSFVHKFCPLAFPTGRQNLQRSSKLELSIAIKTFTVSK